MKRLLFLIIITIFCTATAAFASTPSVAAEGALLIESNTGRILFEKNKDVKFYPASTTKIMTALLVLEHCQLDDKVIVGENPPYVKGSKIYIFEGEEFTVDQLLYALLIESANDVASAFAEHIAGSDEEFAKLMNKKAKELGCKNTNFTNPHGLYNPDHYTSAYDLYLITKEAMKYETYRKIVTTRSYTLEPTNKQPERRYFHSNNRLMYNNRFHVEGANGAKTGYTTESGHSLVATAYREYTDLMVVLLCDKKPGLWEDAYALMNYGFENFETVMGVAAGNLITSLKIANTNLELPLKASKDLYFTKEVKGDCDIISSLQIINGFKGYILKGQTIGYIEYSYNGKNLGSVDVTAAHDLPITSLYNYKSYNNGIKNQYNSYLLTGAAFVIAGFFAGAELIKRRRR
ncbi:D-alanyl-D-alanine carboxypeptidase family protein [Oxobacter pfennigii]|uniref:D-alanyl-D-alanine carboxypeptidase family protein n=1 Tax=Oxobacter pfennigii TaxID=36849 RepID=UPI0006D4832E|nr:D-alanyl-D-alanine carboxypeptidase family protein [Oxobacter pfennigii]